MSTIASQITSLTIVYSTVCSGADQSKHQSSASLAFVWGIHRGPVNSPHKWPATRKMFPFDDVIMEYNNQYQLYYQYYQSLLVAFRGSSGIWNGFHSFKQTSLICSGYNPYRYHSGQYHYWPWPSSGSESSSPAFLLHDGTKPMLTYPQSCYIEFSWEEFTRSVHELNL